MSKPASGPASVRFSGTTVGSGGEAMEARIRRHKLVAGRGSRGYIKGMLPPQFPEFKPIELGDRAYIHERLWEYQPQNSELTFTNLFIWRPHYGFLWSAYKDWLLFLGTGNGAEGDYGLLPVGPPSRVEVCRVFLQWLRDEKGSKAASIQRADKGLVDELAGGDIFSIEATRDHFDYVYRTEDLIRLEGKNYRQKRNHINYFLREYRFDYEPLEVRHVEACLDLTGMWCEVRRCEEDLNLMGEWDAIREALKNFDPLRMAGGVVLINGRVEAFTLGELLNEKTAVVHIEKATTEVRGLYAVINQQFCEKQWQGVPFVNREQDMGEAGLRQAKLSYNPDHMVEKFRITLTG